MSQVKVAAAPKKRQKSAARSKVGKRARATHKPIRQARRAARIREWNKIKQVVLHNGRADAIQYAERHGLSLARVHALLSRYRP